MSCDDIPAVRCLLYAFAIIKTASAEDLTQLLCPCSIRLDQIDVIPTSAIRISPACDDIPAIRRLLYAFAIILIASAEGLTPLLRPRSIHLDQIDVIFTSAV